MIVINLNSMKIHLLILKKDHQVIKLNKGLNFTIKKKIIIQKIEKEFNVEKELLLALNGY